MKPQDLLLIGFFTLALIFAGCEDEEDSPPTPPQSTCELMCFNGGLVNADSCLCACLPGFSGVNCEIVDPTCELVCLNGGVLDVDSCFCDCPQGFTGDGCEIEATITDLLTANDWMVVGLNIEPAIDIDNNGTEENNLIPFIPACTLDDFFDFNTDGSYTIEEGASKCDPNDPDIIETGNWSWNSDNTNLIFEPNGGTTRDAEVISISATEIILEFPSDLDNVTYTETQTWN